ncbi:PQQ-binding-like beta-propeller repeat protein [Verrucomicrobiota bacterium]
MHRPWQLAHFGSPAVADGLVIVGTDNGGLWALEPIGD